MAGAGNERPANPLPGLGGRGPRSASAPQPGGYPQKCNSNQGSLIARAYIPRKTNARRHRPRCNGGGRARGRIPEMGGHGGDVLYCIG